MEFKFKFVKKFFFLVLWDGDGREVGGQKICGILASDRGTVHTWMMVG
jgi:hypothetical protein